MANYSLFKVTRTEAGKKRYTRVPNVGAYPKAQAVRVFQSQLINSAFSPEPLELRVVKDTPSPIPANHILCLSCEMHFHDCAGAHCACGCRLVRQG